MSLWKSLSKLRLPKVFNSSSNSNNVNSQPSDRRPQPEGPRRRNPLYSPSSSQSSFDIVRLEPGEAPKTPLLAPEPQGLHETLAFIEHGGAKGTAEALRRAQDKAGSNARSRIIPPLAPAPAVPVPLRIAASGWQIPPEMLESYLLSPERLQRCFEAEVEEQNRREELQREESEEEEEEEEDISPRPASLDVVEVSERDDGSQRGEVQWTSTYEYGLGISPIEEEFEATMELVVAVAPDLVDDMSSVHEHSEAETQEEAQKEVEAQAQCEEDAQAGWEWASGDEDEDDEAEEDQISPILSAFPSPPARPNRDSPPYHPFSAPGRKRFHTICAALGMPLDTPFHQVEDYLSENLSIIRALSLRSVPHPDRQTEVRINDEAVLESTDVFFQAILEIHWLDEHLVSYLDTLLANDEASRLALRVGSAKMREGRPSRELHKILMREEEYRVAYLARREEAKERCKSRPASHLRNEVFQEESDVEEVGDCSEEDEGDVVPVSPEAPPRPFLNAAAEYLFSVLPFPNAEADDSFEVVQESSEDESEGDIIETRRMDPTDPFSGTIVTTRSTRPDGTVETHVVEIRSGWDRISSSGPYSRPASYNGSEYEDAQESESAEEEEEEEVEGEIISPLAQESSQEMRLILRPSQDICLAQRRQARQGRPLATPFLDLYREVVVEEE